MRATMIHGPGDIRLDTRPDPVLRHDTDAIVQVVRSCVCGSDLWPYRGVRPTDRPRPIGHEFIGTVVDRGSAVTGLGDGDFVIAPFTFSDGDCAACRRGLTSSCERGGVWGAPCAEGGFHDGGQGDYVRVPLAETTLVRLPQQPEVGMYRDLLALSDVMGTGHHAAVSAQVGPGDSVVVVGDGAVGQCAVAAAARLGAERIVMMSRRNDRQTLARRMGATDVVPERGADGVAAVLETLGGPADAALECVGTEESFEQSLGVLRPGGRLGYVGVPATSPALPLDRMFGANITVAGGMAPVRPYIDLLLPDVLTGKLSPGLVFDRAVPLSQVDRAYTMMDQRTSIKTMLTH